MRFFKIFAPILIADLILLWLWMKGMSQDPSSSMVVVTIVPIILGLNLAIAGILYLFKNSEYSKYFILNALIASAIFYAFFVSSVRKFNRENYSTWYFLRSDTTYVINHEIKTDSFFITMKVDPNSSVPLLSGKCVRSDEGLLLSTDSVQMTLNGVSLSGFPGITGIIDLVKVEK